MRTPKYLSPSSINKYGEDASEFYLHYLTDTPPPRSPQTQAMSIGSAFDSYVKAYLQEGLFGKGSDPKFDFDNLFVAQVEEQWRDWALHNGKYIFEQYKQSGCLSDLMLELESSIEPRFEFDVMGVVNGYREGVVGNFGEVVLMGKPDLSFTTKAGVHVVLDFKVNGYCSKYARSPDSHYIRMRSAGRRNHGMHNKCRISDFNGMMINGVCGLDGISPSGPSWAQQLAIYGWLLGEPVGSDFVTIIHQIVCNPNKGTLPAIRIAEHINKIGKNFQQSVFDSACTLWEIVHSEHYFRNMSLEESKARCAILDTYGQKKNGDSLENWVDNCWR
jgi:hypothetical protein